VPGQLERVVDDLRKFYGRTSKPTVTKPFEQVLWENVAYLVDEERRARAFALLREQIGTSPDAILRAPQAKLLGVTGHGMLAESFAAKLRSAAATAMELGDLEAIARGPLPQARRALRRFPGIAEPGADRILLFSRTHAVPALESNGSRALQRLGLVAASGSYAQVHRAGTKLIAAELGPDFDPLIETYQLLRRHGQELCRRSQPLCEGCPLRDRCAYYARLRRWGSGLKP
jgi:endonuclease III